MECPKCNNVCIKNEITCRHCGYLFDDKLYNILLGKVIYPIIIDETITKYATISINQYKQKRDAKIIFKNISTKDISQSLSGKLSYEESAINFYKQKRYDAFFAENEYWMNLYCILHDYKNFVNKDNIKINFNSKHIPSHYYFMFGNYVNNDNIKINFNSLEHISNITDHVIKTYFKYISKYVPPHEFYNTKDYFCYLRNNFKLKHAIITSSYLTEKQLLLILERMNDDLEYYSYGFPDLIVYNDNEFYFVEVKSKNDKSSFKQIQWHKFLAEVVGIDVILFMIDKSDKQILNIKKSYDVELEDSKKRKQKANDDNKKISIDWNRDDLKQHRVEVSNDDFKKLIKLRDYYYIHKKVVNEYTYLHEEYSIEEMKNCHLMIKAKGNELVYKKARELYSVNVFEDFAITKKQKERNRKAKSFEDKGNYYDAVNLYMENVIEKTSSPTTYKHLIHIFNKLNRFNDVVNLMDIAIPLFITLNDIKNALKFIYQKWEALLERNIPVYTNRIEILSDIDLEAQKNLTKQH